jgi:hypothetical protein
MFCWDVTPCCLVGRYTTHYVLLRCDTVCSARQVHHSLYSADMWHHVVWYTGTPHTVFCWDVTPCGLVDRYITYYVLLRCNTVWSGRQVHHTLCSADMWHHVVWYTGTPHTVFWWDVTPCGLVDRYITYYVLLRCNTVWSGRQVHHTLCSAEMWHHVVW